MLLKKTWFEQTMREMCGRDTYVLVLRGFLKYIQLKIHWTGAKKLLLHHYPNIKNRYN